MSDNISKWIITTLLSLAVGGLYAIAGEIGKIKTETETTTLYAVNIKATVDLINVKQKWCQYVENR